MGKCLEEVGKGDCIQQLYSDLTSPRQQTVYINKGIVEGGMKSYQSGKFRKASLKQIVRFMCIILAKNG